MFNMKYPLTVGMILVVCFVCNTAHSIEITTNAPVREKISLNQDWRFQHDDPQGSDGGLGYFKIKSYILPSGNSFTKDPSKQFQLPAEPLGQNVTYTQPTFDDQNWRNLNLPHDWGIEGPFKQEYPGGTGKLPWWGVAWYRKHFTIPTTDAGKHLFLQIDGAMSYATVWLNGQFVGGWPYGYSSFQLELTQYIKTGADNVLSIRLDNPKDSSRWYPGGGIYRNVWLIKTNPIHVAQWGTYITTPKVSADEATVNIRADIQNQSSTSANLSITTTIYDADTEISKILPKLFTIDAGKTEQISTQATLTKPILWNLNSPHLYTARTLIEQDGKIIDQYDTPFGVRTIQFTGNNGFLLNGKRVPLNGVCNHHDLGALGAAFNVRAAERQLEIMKEFGFNALRTSHNPPAPELLDLCDRMGILVMDESFDCWKRGKTRNDYNRLWDDWHEKDLRAEYRRDRNHPSIIMWSIGNEVIELSKDAEGPVFAAELSGIAHDEDPTRPTVLGSNNRNSGYNGVQTSVDVFGENYQLAGYERFHEVNPAIPLLGSETSSCVSSRGEYFFPVSFDKKLGKSDFQVSSYDLYAPAWAYPPDLEFKSQEKNPNIAGEFVWTGFDYLGEPTPYNGDVTNLLNFHDAAGKAEMEKQLKELGKIKVPSRSSYFGIVDLAGFKKDRFYSYQAHWRPELPMAHIFPHWNWPDRIGQVTPVHVYTSGDEAELFLNGKSLGRKKKNPFEYRLRWDDVVYEPGELKIIAYKDGKHWAEDTVKTTGEPDHLTLQADRSTITADGLDLSFITVTVVDKDGLQVPKANNLIQFEITGPGEIVAVDNGNAISFEPFQAKERLAYNGLALVIVRTKPTQPGIITLTAKSKGIVESKITIKGK